MPVRIDGGRAHWAQAYPEEKDGKFFLNEMGFIFYDAGLHQRVYDSTLHSNTTFDVRLDGFLSAAVKAKAQADADQAVNTAAGPLSSLINARSVTADLPLQFFLPAPMVDLNPQDKVFHQYVADCNAQLTPAQSQQTTTGNRGAAASGAARPSAR